MIYSKIIQTITNNLLNLLSKWTINLIDDSWFDGLSYSIEFGILSWK